MLTLAPPLAGPALFSTPRCGLQVTTDYAVLVSEPADGPPVITVSCIGFLTGVGLNGSGFAMACSQLLHAM